MIRKQLLLIVLVAFIIGVSGCGDQAVSAGDHPAFYYFWAKW